MSEALNKLPPDVLRRAILYELKEPVVFSGLIEWNILSWDLKDWSEKLGNKLMPFRTGSKKSTWAPQWERTCSTTHLTMQQFVDVVENNVRPCSSTAAEDDDKWLYFDYKYMHEWFLDNPEVLQSVDWTPLGFPEMTGLHSSAWIGSDGAHTPCHMDSYGCNLVAQIYGTKEWILFPPDLSEQMLPTRIPYEESSVYSKHNFYCPDMKIELKGARVVKLKPGDVLFVPHHWWHYVENIGPAISINTWINLDDVVSCPIFTSIRLVDACVEKMKEGKSGEKNEAGVSVVEKSDLVVGECGSVGDKTDLDISKYDNIIPVQQWPVGEFRTFLLKKREQFKCENIARNTKAPLGTTIERILNAFCHPDVISKVKTILCDENLSNSSQISKNKKRYNRKTF